MMYRDNFITSLNIVGIYLDEYWFVGPSGRFTHINVILDCLGRVYIWVELPVQRRLCPIFVSNVRLLDIHEFSAG